MSRTVSSSGDAWGRSLSNEVLFNGVLSESLSNGVASYDPFNGIPSLGEGETNDGADARLGLKRSLV